jgi:hypothetical protein
MRSRQKPSRSSKACGPRSDARAQQGNAGAHRDSDPGPLRSPHKPGRLSVVALGRLRPRDRIRRRMAVFRTKLSETKQCPSRGWLMRLMVDPEPRIHNGRQSSLMCRRCASINAATEAASTPSACVRVLNDDGVRRLAASVVLQAINDLECPIDVHRERARVFIEREDFDCWCVLPGVNPTAARERLKERQREAA